MTAKLHLKVFINANKRLINLLVLFVTKKQLLKTQNIHNTIIFNTYFLKKNEIWTEIRLSSQYVHFFKNFK